MEHQSIIEQIHSIRSQMNEIEKRINTDSLTIEQIRELDGEWEILDAELSMYDDMLETAQTLAYMSEAATLEEPIEEDWANPSDEDVDRWDLERQRMSGWGYEGEGAFDLADEV
jgi:hypothetical protein